MYWVPSNYLAMKAMGLGLGKVQVLKNIELT